MASRKGRVSFLLSGCDSHYVDHGLGEGATLTLMLLAQIGITGH